MSSWSKEYYSGLTEEQHQVNDDWFHSQLALLKITGLLGVPNIQKVFNKQGEEIKYGEKLVWEKENMETCYVCLESMDIEKLAPYVCLKNMGNGIEYRPYYKSREEAKLIEGKLLESPYSAPEVRSGAKAILDCIQIEPYLTEKWGFCLPEEMIQVDEV